MCALEGNEDVDSMRQEVHENQGYEGILNRQLNTVFTENCVHISTNPQEFLKWNKIFEFQRHFLRSGNPQLINVSSAIP